MTATKEAMINKNPPKDSCFMKFVLLNPELERILSLIMCLMIVSEMLLTKVGTTGFYDDVVQ